VLSRLDVSAYSFESWEYTLAAFREVQQAVSVRLGKGTGGMQKHESSLLDKHRGVSNCFGWVSG
jgi:hypothetical protein